MDGTEYVAATAQKVFRAIGDGCDDVAELKAATKGGKEDGMGADAQLLAWALQETTKCAPCCSCRITYTLPLPLPCHCFLQQLQAGVGMLP